VFLALLTGNFADAAQAKLSYFDLWRYFVCGAFGDDAGDRNALVAVALDRTRRCGFPPVAPRDVIVIGDTPHDVACAAASGAVAVAVATGFADKASLSAAGADVVFDDLSDTSAVLAALDGNL
jgi:phosphoglycolate phosphatase